MNCMSTSRNPVPLHTFATPLVDVEREVAGCDPQPLGPSACRRTACGAGRTPWCRSPGSTGWIDPAAADRSCITSSRSSKPIELVAVARLDFDRAAGALHVGVNDVGDQRRLARARDATDDHQGAHRESRRRSPSGCWRAPRRTPTRSAPRARWRTSPAPARVAGAPDAPRASVGAAALMCSAVSETSLARAPPPASPPPPLRPPRSPAAGPRSMTWSAPCTRTCRSCSTTSTVLPRPARSRSSSSSF